MTIEKKPTVTLPVWLVSVLVSLLITGFSTWGIISSKSAELEIRATHNENNIKALQDLKVGKDEFNLVIQKLDRVEDKIDRLQEEGHR